MEYDRRDEESDSAMGRRVDRVTKSTITATGVVVLLYGMCLWLRGEPPLREVFLAASLIVTFLVPYLSVIWAFGGLSELACSAVCTVAMTALLGPQYAWLAIPVSGLAVLGLPASRGIPLAVLTTGAVTAALLSAERPQVGQVVTVVISTVLYSAIHFLVGVLGERSRAVLRARGEFAWEAVAEERLRFSRELHDVLGHNLSVISVKTELAIRLLDRDPEAARGEVSSLSDISRRSIADVRRVVHGYRMNSLAGEVAAAEAVLASGDVQVVAGEVPAGLSPEAEEVLCWVVRSAATNILQHARARSCFLEFAVDADWARVRVTNDGVAAGGVVDGGGNGLPGLRQRLDRAGGTLAHSRLAPDRFSLEAAVPLKSPGEVTCPSELSSPRTKF